MKTRIAAFAAAAVVASSAGAATVVTEIGSADFFNIGTANTWTSVGTAGAGTIGVTSANPRSGNGSLQLSTSGAGSKSSATFNATRFNPIATPMGTLGDLAAGSISFDFFRDGSSTNHVAQTVALEIAVRNGNGTSATLKWEATYNGFAAAPVDTWTSVSMDGDTGNFWMYRTGGAVEDFDVTLNDWVNTTFGDGRVELGADTMVLGVALQAGSGWAGDFLGYADNLHIQFGNGGASYEFNFETEGGQVIPLPSAAGMGLIGLGLLGGYRRRLA